MGGVLVSTGGIYDRGHSGIDRCQSGTDRSIRLISKDVGLLSRKLIDDATPQLWVGRACRRLYGQPWSTP